MGMASEPQRMSLFQHTQRREFPSYFKFKQRNLWMEVVKCSENYAHMNGTQIWMQAWIQ